jgi:hypothetical protein
LKPFYESWMTELTAFVELAEPIYEEWACHMLSQWHKIKALTKRKPSTKIKKNQICFLFLLSFIFRILLYFYHSLTFLFFYFNIEDNVMFKVWRYWESFGFLCCVKKIYMFDLFELALVYENMSIMYEN